MRKLLTAFFIIIVIISNAQIQKFNFSGSKTYPEGNQISYFNLNGIKDKTEALYIQKEFIEIKEVIRFKVYEGRPINRCMMESQLKLSEDYIFNKLKSYQENYQYIKTNSPKEYSELLRDLYNIQDFPYYKNTGNKYADDKYFANEYANWKNNNPDKNSTIQHIGYDTIGLVTLTNN